MKKFFTILHDDTSTITDHSLFLKDYTTNPVPLALGDTHHLYIGYDKPFPQMFIELSFKNDVTGTLVFEYFNGTAWVALPDFVEETQNFFRSGFVFVDKPDDWASTTVKLIKKFYIRIQPSASHNAGTIIDGIGIVFSNDLDIIGIKSNIVSKHNNGNSWIEKHEAARKLIIQKLRNAGHRTHKTITGNSLVFSGAGIRFTDLNEFDLLEPQELREASKFYVLSFIYLDELSDEEDDKWERAGKRHEARGDEAVQLFMLKIDKDDDGIESESESEGTTRINLSWV